MRTQAQISPKEVLGKMKKQLSRLFKFVLVPLLTIGTMLSLYPLAVHAQEGGPLPICAPVRPTATVSTSAELFLQLIGIPMQHPPDRLDCTPACENRAKKSPPKTAKKPSR